MDQPPYPYPAITDAHEILMGLSIPMKPSEKRTKKLFTRDYKPDSSSMLPLHTAIFAVEDAINAFGPLVYKTTNFKAPDLVKRPGLDAHARKAAAKVLEATQKLFFLREAAEKLRDSVYGVNGFLNDIDYYCGLWAAELRYIEVCRKERLGIAMPNYIEAEDVKAFVLILFFGTILLNDSWLVPLGFIGGLCFWLRLLFLAFA